jgi:hypothetical protein
MSLHRPTNFSAAVVLLVAALALVLGGCTSDEDATATGTTAVASATATVEVRPTVTPTPRPTETATATPAASPGEFGAASADPITGDVTVLFRSSEARRALSYDYSILTPGGNAIWFPTSPEQSTRFALDGTPTDTFPGWAIVESADGRSRTAFVGDGAEQRHTLLAVRDDGRVEETSGIDSWGRTFSPDGRRLAWIEFTPGIANGQVIVLNLPGGSRTTLVDGLERCDCDAQPPLNWSPSGEYLAYEDPADGSANIVHVQTRDVRTIPNARVAEQPWVALDGAEWLLTIGLEDNAILLTPAAADAEEKPRFLARPSGAASARIQESLVLVRTVSNREHHALIFDPVSGEQLRDLRGEGDVVLTSDGIATAIITRTELACTGLVVEHPGLHQTLPCDMQSVLWSPDARYLALFPTSDAAPIRILDTRTGARVSVKSPHPDAEVSWSGDGSHLLFTWGVR